MQKNNGDNAEPCLTPNGHALLHTNNSQKANSPAGTIQFSWYYFLHELR